jgi:hypothetical protein
MKGLFIANEVLAHTNYSEWMLDEGCDVCNGVIGRSTQVMLEFAAVNLNGTAKINWTTASEYLDAKYIVWRSTDGVNFEKIAAVDSRGIATDASRYEAFDYNPKAGTNFYRLEIVLKNGSLAQTETRRVDFDFAKIEASGMLVFPNPTIDRAFVRTEGFTGQTGQLLVVNQFGKTMFSQKFNEIPAAPIELDTKNWPTGTYFVQLHVDANRPITQKLVVIKP